VAKENVKEVILPTAIDRPPAVRALPMREQKPKSIATSKKLAPVSCAQVWGLLGKGKPVAQVARTLNTTPEKVESCERQVGRGKGQKTRSEFDS
jgi:hypothetical protein